MPRPHLEFIDAFDAPPTPVHGGPFAGTSRRLLSEDPDAGAWTGLVACPPDWAGPLSAAARPVELFVLRGTIAIDTTAAGPGTYARVPPGAGTPGAASPAGTLILVLVDAERAPEPSAAARVIDTSAMPWTGVPLDGPVPQGIVVKRLHADAATGSTTWISAVVPGWRESRAEVHDTIEECFMLRGDILLGARGVMGPGSYFWRPPGVKHGPMCSLNGGVFFFRSIGGSLSTRHVAVPDWEARVARYAATQPYFPRTDVDR
jgi:hypothetical protein